jgi:hypothetical protein
VSGNSADESISDGNKSGSEGELQKKGGCGDAPQSDDVFQFRFRLDRRQGLTHPTAAQRLDSTPVRNDL